MPKDSRYLILNADERTWKFDRPVIFLNQSCCKENRKHIWKNMDAIIVPSYLNLSKKDVNYNKACALEDELLLNLTNILNQYHVVNHSVRFWRILIGPWLQSYINVVFKIFENLQQCLQICNINGMTLNISESSTLASKDSLSAFLISNDDGWKGALIFRILGILGNTVPINFTEKLKSPDFYLESKKKLKTTFLRKIYKNLGELTSYIAKDSDAFIINSYLPKKGEIKLQLSLHQFPQFWTSEKIEIKEEYNNELRKNLSSKLITNSLNDVDYILNKLIFELMPIVYLEGFLGLCKEVKQKKWPKAPKFIFTSNNFNHDEIFKLWTAQKIQLGSIYVCGQHGNNYGTHRYVKNTTEEITADKFLTWGWIGDSKKYIPAFIFSISCKKNKISNSKGGLLFMQRNQFNYCEFIYDTTDEYQIYLDEQLKFVSLLNSSIKNMITIRLHRVSNEYLMWRNFSTKLNINLGFDKIENLIEKNRLIVFSYDSTGLLQALALNIPTIVFWDKGLDHLRDNVKPDYQLLVDVGILHFSSTSAAKKVNEIWNNLDAWWWESKLQENRKYFTDRYAKHSKNPIRELKKILLEKIS